MAFVHEVFSVSGGMPQCSKSERTRFLYFIELHAICKLAVMHRITARKLCGISGVPFPPKERAHAQAEGSIV